MPKKPKKPTAKNAKPAKKPAKPARKAAKPARKPAGRAKPPQRTARALAAAPAATDTRARVRAIIEAYGLVSTVTNSTIVGPAVPNMQRFTDDVNSEFGKNYVNGQLNQAWTVNQTAAFIDNN